jgi:CheY-like chemotaxis protein
MRTPHALVVDDESDNREALAQILESRGYTVRQAENGRVALDMIGEQPPSLMLLDLEMPVMNGWEVLAWLQHDPAWGKMAVVVLSARGSAPPNITFVRKPCQIDHLLSAIGAAHELRCEPIESAPEGRRLRDGQPGADASGRLRRRDGHAPGAHVPG